MAAGIEQAGYCLGCCWALMAALFALGVMSIGWMVLIEQSDADRGSADHGYLISRAPGRCPAA